MPEVKLKITDLVLDHDNPRITHSEGQQEALQKIVKDQKTKLVKLAQSITERGLNPMDRLLVLRQHQKPERFIALEGNRRVAAFKLLSNPSVMSGLDMPAPMKRILERLASEFSKSKVEPIACFELSSRKEGDYWLELRHQGERQGAGIVDWTSVASGRFRTRTPAMQALEMVTERGGLSRDQLDKITDNFPLSTLQRFVEDRKVRKAMGLDVKNGKLVTTLPAKEVIKPLKRVVLDLATKQKRVGSLMKTDQMLDYVDSFDRGSKPDLSTVREIRTVDDIPASEFGKASTRPAVARRKPDPSDRREIVPKSCRLNVTDNRIADIYKELRTLRIDDTPNSIAVMLRVFLELSVDHYLEKNNIPLDFTPPNGSRKRFKELDKKLAEVVSSLISIGAPAARFKSVARAVSDANSPMHTDLLHRYVHDRYATPVSRDLKAAWDHAQPLFESIWS